MLIDFYILGCCIMLGLFLREDSEDNTWWNLLLVSLFSWVGIGMVIGEFFREFNNDKEIDG